MMAGRPLLWHSTRYRAIIHPLRSSPLGTGRRNRNTCVVCQTGLVAGSLRPYKGLIAR